LIELFFDRIGTLEIQREREKSCSEGKHTNEVVQTIAIITREEAAARFTTPRA